MLPIFFSMVEMFSFFETQATFFREITFERFYCEKIEVLIDFAM